jgi:hypothetical protein
MPIDGILWKLLDVFNDYYIPIYNICTNASNRLIAHWHNEQKVV